MSEELTKLHRKVGIRCRVVKVTMQHGRQDPGIGQGCSCDGNTWSGQTIRVIGWQESAEATSGFAPLRVVQVVTGTVRGPVTTIGITLDVLLQLALLHRPLGIW